MFHRQPTAHVGIKAIHKSNRVLGTCVNLCVGGALIHAPGLEVKKNSIIDLCFMVRLNNGKVTKLHHKEAVVIHITSGNIGVSIGNRTKR